MGYKVCILAAGAGTRMGEVNQITNKVLLPLQRKAVISHIIERFEDADEFVIAVGHCSEDVKAYLALAHPQQKISFVSVDPFVGPGSGPGYSLFSCREKLNSPFYLICGDTLWDEPLPMNCDESWIGVSPLPADENPSSYCMVLSEGGGVREIRDKENLASGSRHEAFMGLFYIHDSRAFFDGVKLNETVNGEIQLSAGLKTLAKNGRLRAVRIPTWRDVGTQEHYAREVEGSQHLRKRGEFFYLVTNRVIKFFEDPEVVYKRVERSRLFPELLPAIVATRGRFYAYDFIPGHDLYELNNTNIMQELLEWFDLNLWARTPSHSGDLKEMCLGFYKLKTEKRVARTLERYPELTESAERTLSNMNWGYLADGVASRIHGDLQFGNIILGSEGRIFLIDWRQDFGGRIEFGDLYYDLAKLLAGLILDFSKMEKGQVSVADTRNLEVSGFDQHVAFLREFVRTRNLDFRKVRVLAGISFLNMSAMHFPPVDRLLFLTGLRVLNEAPL